MKLRILLDEQLDDGEQSVTRALNVFSKKFDFGVKGLSELAPGIKDPEIPAFCRRRKFHILVSFNHKDFGAKVPLYQALIDEGISVVVLRPAKKIVMVPETQASILIKCIEKVLVNVRNAKGPTLQKVTESGVEVVHNLAELVAKIEGEKRH